MNKVQSKRFAFLAILLSLFFAVTAFAFTSMRTTANAEGETEIEWCEQFGSDRWVAAQEVRLPTPQFNADIAGTDGLIDHVSVTTASGTTYGASHVYIWSNGLTFYFLNTGYDGQKATAGDVLTVNAGFTVTFQGTVYKSTEAISYKFNGASWISNYVDATEITVENEDALVVNNGATLQLNATLVPENSSDLITYTSLDTAKATVSESGLVSALQAGTAQIKLTAGSAEKTVTITIKEPPTISSVTVEGKLSIYQYGRITDLSQSDTAFSSLKGKVVYSDESTDDFNVTKDMVSGWDNVNTDVAGDYTVTVTRGSSTANLTVTVTPSQELTVTVKSSTQNPGCNDTAFFVLTNSTSTTVDNNDVAALRQFVSMTFPDGTPADIWFCRVYNNEARFFIREQGGTANIDSESKIPVGCKFTVKKGFHMDETYALKEDITFIFKSNGFVKLVPATAITVENENNLSVNRGASLQLNATLTPTDSSDDIVYTVVEGGVTVNASGLVTGTAVGTAKVKLTAGSVEKIVTITVKEPPTVTEITVEGTLEIFQYAKITDLTGSESVLAGLKGVYHYSDSTTDEFEITQEMITGWDAVNTEVAKNYTLTVEKDDKTAELTLTVKESTILTFVDCGQSSWNSMYVVFSGSVGTFDLRPETQQPPADKDLVEANMRAFATAKLKNDASGVAVLSMQFNYASAEGQRTVNIYWQIGGNLVTPSRGDMVTLKKGFPVLATATVSERIAEDITFIFNGTKWEKFVEPTSISISNKEQTLFKNVPHALQLATDPANANAALTFESNHPEYATVSDTGVITPVKLTDGTVTEVTVTVRYKDLSDTITFVIENEPQKTGIVIENKILYYVPLNSSFTAQGYELYYHFVYDNGKSGESFTVAKEQIGEADFDFTKEGDRPITITVEGFTDTVDVHVYEVIKLVKWQDLGVDGYGDDRNQAGQWAGNMLITARNYSSSAANFTGQVVDIGMKEVNKMFDYVTYTTADGQNVYTRENGKLGGWLLGSTILVSVNGKGFTGAPENGFMLGDKITFKKGMPLYGWSGELDTTLNPNDVSTPKAGTGCMYVIGILEDDLTYFCYDQNDTYSMWTPYVEYTDFTVRSSISITVEGVGSLGATFTPADSSTGYFTYVSSDPKVVTVNESGNLVGVKEGTATITVTAHPIEASGYELELPSKTVNVTVKKGIAKVSGSFKVKKGATFDPANYKVTVEFTDGTTEEIALNDDRVTAEEVDTSVVGESNYLVMVNIDGTSKRGTFTVNVTKGGGCGSYLAGGNLVLFGAGFAFVLTAIIIRRKKKQS